MNQAGLFGRDSNSDVSQTPVNVYNGSQHARLFSRRSEGEWRMEMAEKKEAAGKTPSLTSRTLNILITCLLDKKTSPLFFQRRSRETGKNIQREDTEPICQPRK